MVSAVEHGETANQARKDPQGFSQALLAWYDVGHRAFPWRETSDPYATWISEVMLQQTRAGTVIGYYERFLERFPTVWALAAAPEQELLKAWEGLGYYSRAHNLQRAAQRIVEVHGGMLPASVEALRALPGIGEYTAGAIASMAFGVRAAAVDGNVERVIARVTGIRREITVPSVRREIRACAEALVPAERPGDFNNAMIELGASLCAPGTPDCERCPVRGWCDASRVGDADVLPVKQRVHAPKAERRGVAIVRQGGRVLVQRRTERMLGGLWQFPNALNAEEPEALRQALHRQGVDAVWVGERESAKHVFTHRVWEMRLHRFAAQEAAELPESLWVDVAGLEALPLPTAMRAAKQEALAWLAEPFS